jgi:Ca-activated chloride channel family protein
VGVALRPEGGDLVVRGRTPEGTWEQRLQVAPVAAGEGSAAVGALFGREAVEDLEMRLAAGWGAREIDAAVERIGLDFQISTRLTSWVAVSEEATVDPGDPLRRQRMPQELPYGMSAEGLGLRPASPAPARSPKLGIEVWGGRAGAPMPQARAGAPRRVTYDPRAAQPLPRPGGVTRAPGMGGGFGGGGGSGGGGGFGSQKAGGPRRPVDARQSSRMDAWRDEKKMKRSSPRSEPDDASRAAAPLPRPTLRGRIVIHRDGLLVLEIPVEGAALAWEPRGEAVITMVTGLAVLARIDGAATTRPGSVAPGTVVRLALVPKGPRLLDEVRLITLQVGVERVTITVG